jgi:hypothetical protein
MIERQCREKPLKPTCKNLLVGALIELIEKSLKGFMPGHLPKTPKLTYHLVLSGYFGMLKFICPTPYTTS